MAHSRSHHRTHSHFLQKFIFFLIGLLVLTLFLCYENRALQVCNFQIELPTLPKGFDNCRIAVLGDLHGAEFGKENHLLFSRIKELKPEYIMLLGDLEDQSRGATPGYAESVADGLSSIAPTYYVTGNHEWAIGDVPKLKHRLSEHGITVLSNQYITLERNGGSLLLAGIDDPNGYADQKTPEQLAEEIYQNHRNPFWILLAHRNNRFVSQYSLLGADLVLTAHGHGGVIRLPFTDGLIDADRSLFPSHTAGIYEANGSTLFVTRGLGNSGPSFRLFNRPEIAILTLHKG